MFSFFYIEKKFKDIQSDSLRMKKTPGFQGVSKHIKEYGKPVICNGSNFLEGRNLGKFTAFLIGQKSKFKMSRKVYQKHGVNRP